MTKKDQTSISESDHSRGPNSRAKTGRDGAGVVWTGDLERIEGRKEEREKERKEGKKLCEARLKSRGIHL